MSGLRDHNPMLPSYAAIVRQQTARLEEPVHLDAVVDDGLGAAASGPRQQDGQLHGQQQEQQDRWVICDQEEALLYI